MHLRYILAGGTALLFVAILKRNTIVEAIKKLTRTDYISKFGPLVKKVTLGTGLFPSVNMAQGILESGNGNSSLAAKHHNHFGIKADKSWKGAVAEMKTTEYVNGKPVTIIAKFRKYSSPEAGFLDRVKFLKTMKRYTNAGVFNATTPEIQARALQNAGYATDPNYANLLISIINKYNLKSLDHD